jgi:hypothetical protein
LGGDLLAVVVCRIVHVEQEGGTGIFRVNYLFLSSTLEVPRRSDDFD